MRDVRSILKLESAGALTVAVGKDRVVTTFNGEIANVAAVVGTAPTGAALVLDIRKNGTTIFTTIANRPTIAIGQTKSTNYIKPDDAKFTIGDVLELTVSQIGSTVAGADLDVAVTYTQS